MKEKSVKAKATGEENVSRWDNQIVSPHHCLFAVNLLFLAVCERTPAVITYSLSHALGFICSSKIC